MTHELDSANAVAREGADVRLSREDHTRQKKKSIDGYVRWGPDDPGTGTEIKTLVGATNTSRAIQRGILKGATQLSDEMGETAGVANGQVVVDARNSHPTDDEVMHACQRTVGRANTHGQVLPRQVVIIMSDDAICAFRPHPTSAEGKSTYAAPDSGSVRLAVRGDQDWNSLWRRP